jgi:rhodanese-related sulfurtransferase
MNLFGNLNAIPHLNPVEVHAKLADQPKPFLLDVRQPEEYTSGHIAGATLIPLGELSRRLKELPRDREILCVCHSGNRSGTAARWLISAGYRAVNLSGGMIQWSRSGLPVKKGLAR